MNLACAYEVRRWYPVDRINEFVREHQIMRLLIGTASRGKLGKLLVGSVAEELIRSLDIPICTVGPGFASVPQSTARRVIFATSLRHNSDGSFLFAVNLALLMEGELTLLHVMEQDYLDEGVDLRVIPEIDEMLQRARQMGCTASIRIRYGEPAEEIVAECSASKSELLVLGAVAASNLATNFRMGVAYRVIAKAPCPTFTLLNGVWTKGHTGAGRKVSALL
jgi:nucleotide-binding universal stress UspA family protein